MKQIIFSETFWPELHRKNNIHVMSKTCVATTEFFLDFTNAITTLSIESTEKLKYDFKTYR